MVTDEPVHAVEVLAEEAQEYICKEKPVDQMPVERHFHQHTDHILYHKPEKMKGLWLIEERRDFPRFQYSASALSAILPEFIRYAME